jgi:hypothetical protein
MVSILRDPDNQTQSRAGSVRAGLSLCALDWDQTNLVATAMLPCVALEYGQTPCAAWTSSSAISRSRPDNESSLSDLMDPRKLVHRLISGAYRRRRFNNVLDFARKRQSTDFGGPKRARWWKRSSAWRLRDFCHVACLDLVL